MIKLKYIKFQNMRLFKDAELDFTNRTGVYSLVAKNNDLFSSNSSGKSSIAIGIESCLFSQNHKGITMHGLSSKSGFRKPILEIHLDIGDDSYILINNFDDTKATVIYENGEEVPIKDKASKLSYLQDKIGINYHIFTSVFLLNPESKLFFMESDPKKQASLIMELLNLQFIQGYHDQAKTEAKKLDGEYNSLYKIVKNLKESIETLNIQIEAMPKRQIRNVNESIEQLQKEIADIDIKPVEAQLEKVSKLRNEIEKEYASQTAHLNFAEKTLRQVKALDDKCPTCMQDIESAHYERMLEDARSDFDKHKALKEKAYKEMVEIKAEHEKLRLELEELHSQRVQKEYKIKQLKEFEDEDNAQAERNKMIEKLEEQRRQKTLELTEKKLEMDSLEKEIYVYELIKQCAGPKGFIAERIKLFTQLYNKYLTDLSSSLLEGKMLARIEEVKARQFAIIVSDGENEFQFNDLSSGLEARVKIISQLALVEVIQALTGISLNVMIMDEILGTTDEAAIEELESLFDKLRNRFPEKLFLIVSHEKHIRNTDGTLLVERTNGESVMNFI